MTQPDSATMCSDACSHSVAFRNTYKYTGKERDYESGLDNFDARYLGSSLGRFSSPDAPFADQAQSDPQSWNLYGYVQNNPLDNTDPTGNNCISTADNPAFHDDNQNGQTCAIAKQADSHYNPSVVVVADAPSADDERVRELARQVNKRPVLKFVGAVYGSGAVVGATGGAACYAFCGWLGVGNITTLGATVGGTAGPLVTDPRLQKIVDWLFQATDELPGGTAGAVTYEQKMGDLLSPAGHGQKALDAMARLNDLLKSGKLSVNDQVAARQMIQQLRDALATKPFGQNP